MLRPVLATAIGLMALSAAAAFASDRALVIGIDSYAGIRENGVGHARDLRGATNDARRMEELFGKVFGIAPGDMTVLLDEDASRAAIFSAFQHDIVGGTRPGDHVYLYYAGHGAQVIDEDGDESDDGLDEVIVPADAQAELAGDDPTLTGVITDDEIGRLLDQLDGRIVTLVVDSCHSGTITRSASPRMDHGFSLVRTLTPDRPIGFAAARGATQPVSGRHVQSLVDLARPGHTRGAGGPDVAVWSAVSAGQYALEDMSQGGSAGLFTSRFVRGLEGLEADLNRNGSVTPSELLVYLRRQTKLYCGSYDCLGQDPLPLLESFDDYQRYALAVGDGTGTPVAFNDAVPAGDAIIRETSGSAIPTDMLPASGPSVSISLDKDGKLRVGDALSLTVTSPAAGRLIVLDRREGGDTVQLFPNEQSRLMGIPDEVAAGETVTLPGDEAPYRLTADAPGSGSITAVVVDRSVDLGDLVESHQDLAGIADSSGYVTRLAGAVSRAVSFTPSAEAPATPVASAPLVARGDATYTIGQ